MILLNDLISALEIVCLWKFNHLNTKRWYW